jgi:hypothetical protein
LEISGDLTPSARTHSLMQAFRSQISESVAHEIKDQIEFQREYQVSLSNASNELHHYPTLHSASP